MTHLSKTSGPDQPSCQNEPTPADPAAVTHVGWDRTARQHRNCPGRWRGAISLGWSADRKTRIRRKVSGPTKTAVKDELDRIREEMTEGVRTSGTYTLQQAVDAWLDEGMSGRSGQTVAKYRHVLKPVMKSIGGKVLRDLTAADVRIALRALAANHSTGHGVDRTAEPGTGHPACRGSWPGTPERRRARRCSRGPVRPAEQVAVSRSKPRRWCGRLTPAGSAPTSC